MIKPMRLPLEGIQVKMFLGFPRELRVPRGSKVVFLMKLLSLICLCAFPWWVQAETLGRLFYTPEQRAMLDHVRKSTPLNASGEADTTSGQGLSVGGVVTRSDGKRSTWVNGRLEHDTASTSKQDRAQVRVQLPSGEVKLKVGQSIDPATGQVAEGYRRVPPPKPAATQPAPPKAPAKAPIPAARDDNAEPDQPATQ